MPARHGWVVVAGLGLGLAACGHAGAGGAGASAPDGLAIAIYTGYQPPPTPAVSVGEGAPPLVTGRIPADVAAQLAPLVPAASPPPPGPPRISVALVDDRRTVEVDAERRVQLADLADGIELASLIVEPLDGRGFAIISCARPRARRDGPVGRTVTVTTDRGVEITGVLRAGHAGAQVIEDVEGHTHFVRGAPDRVAVPGGAAADVVCQVDAAPGRHRVRLAYATRDLGWQAAYRIDVAVDGDGAAVTTVQPRYTIEGGAVIGRRRAAVSLLVGLPGAGDAPRLAWSGSVELGGGEVAVQPPARQVDARLEHVYRGAVAHRDDNPRAGGYWRQTMTPDVWVVLGLPPGIATSHADLPGGAALVTVRGDGRAPRQAVARWPEPVTSTREGVEVRLWPSPDVIGFRDRRIPWDDGQRLVEQYLFSVANHGDRSVTVWIEEELRPGASSRTIRKAWPIKPERRGDLLRFAVTISPRRTERLGFEAEYRW